MTFQHPQRGRLSLRRAAEARSSRAGLRLVHEGFETLDLKEAKALLDELAS